MSFGRFVMSRKKAIGKSRKSDTGIDVVVLVRDAGARPGAMSVEALTTWEDGERLFYAAVEGTESGWLVKGHKDELVATRSRNARDESIRLVRVPLRTFA